MFTVTSVAKQRMTQSMQSGIQDTMRVSMIMCDALSGHKEGKGIPEMMQARSA